MRFFHAGLIVHNSREACCLTLSIYGFQGTYACYTTPLVSRTKDFRSTHTMTLLWASMEVSKLCAIVVFLTYNSVGLEIEVVLLD